MNKYFLREARFTSRFFCFFSKCFGCFLDFSKHFLPKECLYFSWYFERLTKTEVFAIFI